MNEGTNYWHLTDKVYNVLRLLVTIVLPAISALYVGLAALWGWGYVPQIVGTIALVTVFLASVLGISRSGFQKTELSSQ